MKKDTEARRVKLLQLEGNGLLKPEIVKELVAEFNVSDVTCYNDFNTKSTWQPKIIGMQDALHKGLNRLEQLYRKASLTYLQAETVTQKQSAINLMRTITNDMLHTIYPDGANINAESYKEIELIYNVIKTDEQIRATREAAGVSQ